MNEHPNDEKSCGPLLFDGAPQKSWGVEQLRAYASTQNDAITQSERSVTAHYWRLGKALLLLRENFSHGQWGKCLEELGIDKTRASKACAIHRSFDTEESVVPFTVEAAYEQREKKPRTRSPKECRKRSGKVVQAGLVEWLDKFGMEIDNYKSEAAAVDSSVAFDLLPRIDALIHDLSDLRQLVEERAAAI